MISLSAGADRSSDLDALVRQTESRIDAQYADLIAYRRQVEAGAYDETMRLCAGYRRLRGLGPGVVAGDWRSWARIFKEGIDQPFSAVDGLKGEFIGATQLRIWNLDSWFRSVHTLYLIHSDGFKAAAGQCLGSVPPREIDWFARAIINADVAGSLASGLVSGAGLAQLFSLAKRSTRWAWVPVGRVIGSVRSQITKPMITVAGVMILPLVGANAVQYIADVHRAAKGADDFLKHLSDQQRQLKETGRKLLMAKAVKLLGEGLDKNDLSEFEAWARREVRVSDRTLAHEDYARIKSAQQKDAADLAYESVLRAVLPVLDQLDLPSP